MSASALPFPWDDFAHFQSCNDSRTIWPIALGRDEALTALLGDLGRDDSLRDSERLRGQFRNLCRNRAAKHGRRRRLDKQFAGSDRFASRRGAVQSPLGGRGALAEGQVGSVAIRELVDLIRQEVPESDWQILWMLAEGYSYGEIAARYNWTSECLKCRICRVRSRIRKSRVGRLVQAALYFD